ncbi:type I DNA topoisomerase [Algoriphagus halophytocola]|uniref:DNA topoisomerase 1 n=1 Tax=Algoriphagus halophytocola TaxID=2991499 RepID=A0ABY6MIY3_9BACT|nr:MULTISPECIES: type I DNA topoisomerase [unclassified Algoriphagus]UZD23751.1 type I DNA topoisomerase [Algoriphagus sp. TR-M5]WBL45045.1 type I DNA topoisomerase [Algoriphagus sp. TR-M9]
MSKNLVIVESPAKAKTIEGYLGKDYKVASSYGHVRDLPKGDKAIDIKNRFSPTYEVTADKKEVIKNLKSLVKDAETVYLASDDDREGEAISWHLKEVLKLKDDNTKRIVFREITKNAISKAIENPRGIDIDLVNAQQARRILDRLVGFELSPILWKKIKTGLSAGRVQSVAVRLIVEREREIEQHKAKSSFRITAIFEVEGKTFQAELPKKFDTKEEAEDFLKKCLEADFSVAKLEKKPGKKTPAAPFTTSTMQQEASRKLYFSVAQTMSVAQKLYEAGKITYMRTDSVNLSEDAMASAKSAILNSYGSDYHKSRKYNTKSEGAQEAHEAIRPTDFANTQVSGDRNEQRLYELIWKRAIASQMADAQLEKTIITIDVSNQPQNLVATGEIIKFDGFLKVYLEDTDDEPEEEENDGKALLPPLTVGQVLNLQQMKGKETFTRAAPRYTEASLVKKLEELGIGRPSTYAPTISTIQKREYVIKESRDGRPRDYVEMLIQKGEFKEEKKQETTGAEKQKLFPTNIAMVVNDFLVEHFPNVIDFSFTARVEKEFDDIAAGGQVWQDMLDAFYGNFHKNVEETEQVSRQDVNSSRELGNHPVSGKPMIARLGRFGPLVQIGDADDEEKQFASLKKGQFIENITMEEALELFKLPRDVGMFEDKKMVAAIGRFGPYIRHDGSFVSLPKELDPLSVTEEEAIQLIKDKREADAKKHIKSFDENPEIQILNGRWGPYIKMGKKNYKIPKDKEAETLTYDETIHIIENQPEPKKRGGRFSKKK